MARTSRNRKQVSAERGKLFRNLDLKEEVVGGDCFSLVILQRALRSSSSG